MNWDLGVFGVPLLLFSISLLCYLMGRVGRVERKLDTLLRHHNLDPTKGLPLSVRVRELADDPARKIEAIKLYREESGAGLAEAKEAVEAYIHSK